MGRYIPSSSYRLNLNPGFTFYDAKEKVPYLHDLGIEMVYLSPYFATEKKFLNPYKTVSFSKLDEGLGGERGFDAFCEELKKYNMTHMIDIVPNHMGASLDNDWWYDLLKYGKDSKYAIFFDIDWDYGDGKVVLPILRGEQKVHRDHDHFVVGDFKLPIAPNTTKLEEQNYVLCLSKDVHSRVNYRRFFDIADLVGLRVEDPEVYREVHSQVFKWVRGGKIQGVRVDHPDGLYHPANYCRELRNDLPSQYIVCEKILQRDELIRNDWDVEGSVGYDMLNLLNSLFVNSENEKAFTQIYHEFTGISQDPEVLLYEARRQYVLKYLISEIEIITDRLYQVEKALAKDQLREGLVEFLTRLPVYRTYVEDVITKEDQIVIDEACKTLSGRTKLFFAKVLYTLPYRGIFLRIQQLMPATFAKGFEDTFLYRYNRLVSLNEVGGDPKKFGLNVHEFHQLVQMRVKRFPHSMIATSTHDTKRSEDVRMRIAALSEIPEKWREKVFYWREINGAFSDKNAEYLFYQSLIGIWPTEEPANKQTYIARLQNYMVKAIREAKVYTDWMSINASYEGDLKCFIEKILLKGEPKFWESFYPFLEEVSKVGERKSLSMLLLKLTLPGVPDFYQGNEDFRYDLVDPDNRRSVNFTNMSSRKVSLIKKWLSKRNNEKELFTHGDYIPLEIERGQIAFKRKYRDNYFIIESTL